jgi:hypothetical protein
VIRKRSRIVRKGAVGKVPAKATRWQPTLPARTVLRRVGGSNVTYLSECAEHVQQFGGESPLPNLMEVKG